MENVETREDRNKKKERAYHAVTIACWVMTVFFAWSLLLQGWNFAQQSLISLSTANQRAQQLEQQLQAERAKAAAKPADAVKSAVDIPR